MYCVYSPFGVACHKKLAFLYLTYTHTSIVHSSKNFNKSTATVALCSLRCSNIKYAQRKIEIRIN